MKIKKIPQLEPKTFYQVGKYAFFVIGLIGMIRVVDLFNELESYEVFGSLASITFNFILSWFFATLQSKEDIKEVNDSDIVFMNKTLDNLELKGGNKICLENTSKKKTKKKSKEIQKKIQKFK